LAQQRDQRVADQCVDFVEHEHQRFVELLTPPCQKTPTREACGVSASTRRANLRTSSHCPRLSGAIGDTSVTIVGHRLRHIFAQRLRGLDVGVDGIIVVTLVQIVGQRQQTGGLAGLARGMEQEVLLLRNQPSDFDQVEARQGAAGSNDRRS
jgi:hypothetical protein